MRITRSFASISIAVFFSTCLLQLQISMPVFAQAAATTPNVAVEPQYDTAHVYVAPEDFDRFVASIVATFGGTTSKQGVFTVTPPRAAQCRNSC